MAITKQSMFSRVLSQPLRLHWLGWTSTTAALQRYGWELSAQQDVYGMKMRMAMQYRERGGRVHQGLSDLLDHDYEAISRFRGVGQIPELASIDMALGQNIQLVWHGGGPDFEPIDARPTATEYKTECMEDLIHFQQVPRHTEEVLLHEASLADVMEYALLKQEPRQQEIRREMLKRKGQEEYRQNSELKAQLRLVV